MLRTLLLALEIPIGNPYPVDGDTRRYDPITAVTGGLGLVGNVASGLFGASAAKKAGAIQQQQANAEADKIGVVTGEANKGINEAAANAGKYATETATNAAVEAKASAEAAAQGVKTSAGQAADILNPYQDAGAAATKTLQSGLEAGGDFNKNFTAADLQSNLDPGYQFRLDQGTQGQLHSRAAGGNSLSGAAIKDLANYQQGLASQETQNAFDRYNTTTKGRYDRLFGVSEQGRIAGTQQGNLAVDASKYAGDIGYKATTYGGDKLYDSSTYTGNKLFDASTTTGENSIGAAKSAADLRTGGAAAKAAGVVGGSNALTKGLTGGIGAATSAINLQQLLKNPATSGGGVTDAYPTGYSGTNISEVLKRAPRV